METHCHDSGRKNMWTVRLFIQIVSISHVNFLITAKIAKAEAISCAPGPESCLYKGELELCEGARGEVSI
jgi:hypothetical protein